MPEVIPRNAERAEEDEPEQKTTAHALMVETQLTPTSSLRGRCQDRDLASRGLTDEALQVRTRLILSSGVRNSVARL